MEREYEEKYVVPERVRREEELIQRKNMFRSISKEELKKHQRMVMAS